MTLEIEEVINLYEKSLHELESLLKSDSSQEEALQKITSTLSLSKQIRDNQGMNIVDSNTNQDALRYKFVSNGILMSDGRPFIARAIYKDGRFVEYKPLTREEANKLIDPLL